MLLLLLSVCAARLLMPAVGDIHENLLYQSLLKDYDPRVRPVKNASIPVRVSLGVVLQQIVDIDEKNQVMEINSWLTFTWHDFHLRWDPKEHNGIADLRFPIGQIWRPDVLLYNSVDSNFDSTYPSHQIAYSDGTVSWIPPGILKASCKIDITWFPFDEQRCPLKFGSWSNHGYALDLQAENYERGIDTSEFIENGEWILLNSEASVVRTVRIYDCCPEPYPTLTFYVIIRRRTMYYILNMIVPCLLISGMTMFAFCLPPDTGEKITFEMTILLTIFFFMSAVADSTPKTSESTPLIGTFFSCVLVSVSVSVCFTVVVLNLHHRHQEGCPLPPLVRYCLLYMLPRLMHMKIPEDYRPVIPDHEREPIEKWSVMSVITNKNSDSLINNVKRLSKDHIPIWNGMLKDQYDVDHKHLSDYANTTDTMRILYPLRQILKEIKTITRHIAESNLQDKLANEWQFAAKVVDRFCLCTFTLFLVGSLLYVLIAAPHLIA
uniref:Uncharacterized protein n=1 Tax=Plectus sambesii TaxID=2011161 RepID=A0A914X9N7_9BILA